MTTSCFFACLILAKAFERLSYSKRKLHITRVVISLQPKAKIVQVLYKIKNHHPWEGSFKFHTSRLKKLSQALTSFKERLVWRALLISNINQVQSMYLELEASHLRSSELLDCNDKKHIERSTHLGVL